MTPETKELCWYAVYTAPRAEKAVSKRFLEMGIDHYLALQHVKHVWSDRIKELTLPVVSGYVFVHIAVTDFVKVINTYGAISFVKKGSLPIAIPEQQIDTFRRMVEKSDTTVEFSSTLPEQGQEVTICKGPLEGLMGELIEFQGKYKVVVRLNRLGCAMTSVPLSFLKRIN